MKRYDITIAACVTKTLTVEAETLESAENLAGELFNTLPSELEQYDQDIHDSRETPWLVEWNVDCECKRPHEWPLRFKSEEEADKAIGEHIKEATAAGIDRNINDYRATQEPRVLTQVTKG